MVTILVIICCIVLLGVLFVINNFFEHSHINYLFEQFAHHISVSYYFKTIDILAMNIKIISDF